MFKNKQQFPSLILNKSSDVTVLQGPNPRKITRTISCHWCNLRLTTDGSSYRKPPSCPQRRVLTTPPHTPREPTLFTENGFSCRCFLARLYHGPHPMLQSLNKKDALPCRLRPCHLKQGRDRDQETKEFTSQCALKGRGAELHVAMETRFCLLAASSIEVWSLSL